MSDKKKAPGRPKTRSETKEPVVREVKVTEPAKEDDGDKKLIIVIAIGILIIIGTIIGLLVGCQKEEKNETEENNTKKEDIVVPITNNDTDEEDETEDIVVRTTTSSTTTKYQITYILDGKKVYTANIAEGKKIKKHVPSGYEKCSYYTDSEHTEKFDFSVKPTDDTKVYLVCSIKEYSVTYKDKDGTKIDSVDLKGEETENYTVAGNGKDNFLGWSKKGNNTIAYRAGQKIDVNENLTLTAVYGATTVVYKSAIVKTKKKEKPAVETNTTTEDSLDVVETDVEIESTTYVDEVEIGYTQDEVDNYTLPSDPSEVGLETPKYYIPTDGETDTSKRIISDDEDEVGERQVRLGDVQGHTPDWYSPAVDDNVEEKDCEFTGWTVNNDPAPSDYKPSTSGENEVVASYQIPEEDQEPPKQESNNNNNTPPAESTPTETASEEVVE